MAGMTHLFLSVRGQPAHRADIPGIADGGIIGGEIMRNLEEATTLAEAAMILPVVNSRRFSLANAADAHQAIVDGVARGEPVFDLTEEAGS